MSQVDIDERLMDALRKLARQTGQTVEELVEEALTGYVGQAGVEDQIAPEDDPLLMLSGVGRSGQQDISERTNDILRAEIDPAHGWTFRRDRAD